MARLAWTDGGVTVQQLNTEHIKTMFKQSLFPPKDNVNQTDLKFLMDIFTTLLKQVENTQVSQSNTSSVKTLKLSTNIINQLVRDKNAALSLSNILHSTVLFPDVCNGQINYSRARNGYYASCSFYIRFDVISLCNSLAWHDSIPFMWSVKARLSASALSCYLKTLWRWR